MIYTYGDRYVYDAPVENGKTLMKVGRREKGADDGPYLGGIVFKTGNQAEYYLNKNRKRLGDNYRTFGVEADWDADTYHIEGEPFHRLTRDARIVPVK